MGMEKILDAIEKGKNEIRLLRIEDYFGQIGDEAEQILEQTCKAFTV
jgi:hypothetical protein